MKIFLTLLNIVLAGLVVWAASGFFKTSSSQTVYTVGRDRSAATENRTRVSAAAPAAMSISEAAGLVNRYNLFNITRCPDAVSGRRGPSIQQMTLIGIYKMGNSRGAIIQQTQQRSWRRTTTTNTNTQQQPVKQFYTVGEVMSNGYTLASIEEDQVTLSRGGSSMQLQLVKAGRGVSTSTTTTQTRPRLSTQQLQQFMIMGQMRMMQQMMQQQNRMMQQGQIPSSNSNRRNSNSGGNSGGSSRSRSR